MSQQMQLGYSQTQHSKLRSNEGMSHETTPENNSSLHRNQEDNLNYASRFNPRQWETADEEADDNNCMLAGDLVDEKKRDMKKF